METIEKKGIGVRSITRSISKGRKVCWSSRMGSKTDDKQVNYSHGPAQTKQLVGSCVVETFLVHG